jgi:hypothetical protein
MMSLACAKPFRSFLSKVLSRPGRARSRRPVGLGIEVLESRQLLSHLAATNVTYYTARGVEKHGTWQGIRGADAKGKYLITGTLGSQGLLFVGSITGKGKSYFVDDPLASSTSVYGPNNLGGGRIQLVGEYESSHPLTDPVLFHGFLFQGTTADLPSGGSFRTIDYPGATYNFVHSTMRGLAVGNYDSPTASGALGPGGDYIYNIATGQFVASVKYPGSVTDTAYGIWYNGGTSYTICGGYSTQSVSIINQNQPIGQGYLVDYNSATGQFSHWTSYSYLNAPAGTTFVTHFEGISEVKKGVYSLAADSVQSTSSSSPSYATFVTVRRNRDGSFGPATWVVPDLKPFGTTGRVSSNSVYGNKVVGILLDSPPLVYQATVQAGRRPAGATSGT